MSAAYAFKVAHAWAEARQIVPQWPQPSGPYSVEFELPGDEAIMDRDGDRLVIEPMRKRALVALLKTMKPPEEDFPAIDDGVPPPENVRWRAPCWTRTLFPI
jgi:antitoxin VapB